jgi:hypothetical protein
MIMFLYMAFLPVIISFINNSAIPNIAGCPTKTVPVCPGGVTSLPGFSADQPTKDLLISLIQLFPAGLALMILASGLFYAIPRPNQ